VSQRMLMLMLTLVVVGCAAIGSQAPGPIVDGAALLTPTEITAMREQVSEIAERSSVQIAVVTVQAPGEESIESYALRTFAAMKLGQAGLNNGVLIVVAPFDRRMRIEVGTGLEWQIPDSTAAAVIDAMIAQFRAEGFAAGIVSGIDQLARLATAVDWSVRYDNVASLVGDGAAAVGRIAELGGTVSALDDSSAVLDVDGASVDARLTPHWSGTSNQLAVGSRVSLVTRVRSVSPLVVEVLGISTATGL
jgi:hypothetical protein